MAIIGDVLANVSDALQQQFIQTVKYQFNTLTPILKHIPKIRREGQQVNFDAVFPNTSIGGNTPEGYVYTTSDYGVNTTKRAYLPWAIYSYPFALTDHEVNVVSTSNSPEQLVFDWVSLKMKESIQNLALKINTGLISGTGSSTSAVGSVASTPDILGLTPGYKDGGSGNTPGAITSNVTGAGSAGAESYAGISRYDYNNWAGNCVALSGGTTVLTADIIENLLTKIFIASGRYPNLLVVSPNVARAYKALFTAASASTIFNMQNVQQGFDPMVKFRNVTNGFNSEMHYGGIPVVVDPMISETSGNLYGKIYALNTDYLEISHLPYANATGFNMSNLREETLVSGIDEQWDATDLPVALKPIPVAGLSTAWAIATTLQLVSRRPQSSGWISGIKVS